MNSYSYIAKDFKNLYRDVKLEKFRIAFSFFFYFLANKNAKLLQPGMHDPAAVDDGNFSFLIRTKFGQ